MNPNKYVAIASLGLAIVLGTALLAAVAADVVANAWPKSSITRLRMSLANLWLQSR